MIDSVLRQYSNSFQVDSLESLANAGGFSGAQLWKAKVGSQYFCVRCWPKAHPTIEHLRWIHVVLLRAVERGCQFIPAPVCNNEQQTTVSHAGHLWEVTPWMPGMADLATNCTAAKVEAAFRALAQFHLAVEPANRIKEPSAGVQERLDFATRLNVELPELASRTSSSSLDGRTVLLCNEIVELARFQLPRLPDVLKPVAGRPLPLQPCIRDIWHQHVLFQGDLVSGIIDFGAMRVETVALDFTRLLGSLPAQDREIQPIAIDAYTQIRPLSELEKRTMLATLDAASILSALTWVRWLVVDGRTFEDMDHVHGRLDELCHKLRS